MEIINKVELVENFLELLKFYFENNDLIHMKEYVTFIVAGSYADWKKNPMGRVAPSWKSIPDLNLYLIIKGTNATHLLIGNKLAEIYRKISKDIEINLLLDLHPFYKSYGKVDDNKFNLQLTSRVINMNDIRTYPDYCWYGWKSNFIELCKNNSGFGLDVDQYIPKRDIVWLKYMYMALNSYNNVVHMIVLSGMFEKRECVFDEIYRYLKEVAKDGISLALSVNEYFDYTQIKQWKNDLVSFYETNYGKEASDVIKRMEHYEKSYFESRQDTPVTTIIGEFAVLFEAVYKLGFLRRKAELVKMSEEIDVPIALWY